jgi:hypothetical protein
MPRVVTGQNLPREQVDAGGMPSSHSSLCMGITTAVAVQQGLCSTLFPVCLGFSLIVMYDAAGVRRHAGKQAEVRARPPSGAPVDLRPAVGEGDVAAAGCGLMRPDGRESGMM